MKNIIISLAVLSCLFQGCEDSKKVTEAGVATEMSLTPTIGTSQGVNENAINPPALPNLPTPHPTEKIKNIN